jgi:hypothetical protein
MAMTSVHRVARAAGAVLAAAAAVAAGAPAEAAALRIPDASVAVSPSGRTTIALHNPARRSAIGTLTLRWRTAVLGRTRFRVPSRRARTVQVQVSVAGAATSRRTAASS